MPLFQKIFKRAAGKKCPNNWKAVCRHFGHNPKIELTAFTGCWKKEDAPEWFKEIENILDWNKKIQVIFEYDPDFPRIFLSIKGTKFQD